LGNQTTRNCEKNNSEDCLYLSLEHRDIAKIGKTGSSSKGVKSKGKRVARGSVFRPREATGGVSLAVEFERLSH